MHALADARDEKGLGEARNPHQEGVPAAEQADRKLFDHIVLTDDDLSEFLLEVGIDPAEFIDGGHIVGREGGGRGGGRDRFLGGDGRLGHDGRFGGVLGNGRISGMRVHEIFFSTNSVYQLNDATLLGCFV